MKTFIALLGIVHALGAVVNWNESLKPFVDGFHNPRTSRIAFYFNLAIVGWAVALLTW